MFLGNNLLIVSNKNYQHSEDSARRVNRKVTYWVGQDVPLGFSITYYGDILANIIQMMKELWPSLKVRFKLPTVLKWTDQIYTILLREQWNTKLLMNSNLQWNVEYLCFQIQKADESSSTWTKRIISEKILKTSICFQKCYTWYFSFFKNYATLVRYCYYYSILKMKL